VTRGATQVRVGRGPRLRTGRSRRGDAGCRCRQCGNLLLSGIICGLVGLVVTIMETELYMADVYTKVGCVVFIF